MVEHVRPEIDNFDPGWAGVVAAITAPTLVVAGGARSPVPKERIAALARILPDAQLVTIEAGHFVHTAEPTAFIRRLVTILDTSPTTAEETLPRS